MSAHTDLTHDEICHALHDLGATRLIWNALPDDDEDGYLEISGLHLEDASGNTLAWCARVWEDGAYDLADALSDEPGTFVLDLPDGHCSHVIVSNKPYDPR